MADLSKSQGKLVMWAGALLIFVGALLVLSDNKGFGAAAFAFGAATVGIGYMIRGKATT